jgi:ubiquitin C-terminal hydrolase
MNIFNNNNIYAVDEVPVIDDNAQVLYNLRNDKLYLMTLSGENRYVSSETFLNVTQIRLIGLSNIGATCYMNATLQCFINNDILTSYLLTESNYKKIIKNGSNLCELTSKYCELLMNVCCNVDVKNYFIPRKFKEVISRKNILFKGIKANDSKDLINFMLEEMNNELNSVEDENNSSTYINNSMQIDQTDKEFMYNFFKTQYTRNNKSIIPKIFFFTIENQTKCLKCNLIKYNYQVVYMFDFALSATYDFCLQNNIYVTNNNYGQKNLSLFNCFEFYIRPSFFTGDNQIYCSRCQMKVNALYGNYIYSLSPTIII